MGTIMSITVRGLGQKQKRLHVFHWLKEHLYLLYMLQETHLNEQEIKPLKTE